MPTQEEERKKLRLVDAHKSGEISIRLYTKDGRDYWNLVRETRNGPVEFAAGRGAELREMQTLLKRAEGFFPSPEKEKPERSWFEAIRAPLSKLIDMGRSLWDRGGEQEQKVAKQAVHYAIVKLTELTATGGVGGVITSFTELKQAERYRDLNPHVALLPSPLSTKPEKGQRVEISFAEIGNLTRKGEGKDFAHQVERLRWKADQGKHFTVALWNDKSKPPEVGQMAHVTTGRDHLDRPIDRLASPLGPFDPGQPNQPQWVVLEHSSRNGIARIAALPGNEADAKTIAREHNHKREVEEHQRSEPAWRALETGPLLRGIAEFERRTTNQSIEKPTKVEIDSPQLKIRTHISGKFEANVIERAGEDGKPQLSVVLTHHYQDSDGRKRSAGAVFSFDELMAHRNKAPLVKEQLKEQPRNIPERANHQEQGPAPAPPIGFATREEAKAGAPKQNFKLDYPSMNPDAPTDGVQTNKFVLAGKWYGVDPPKKGQLAYITQGKAHITERMVIPGELNPKLAEPGDRPQYVIGELVTKNIIRILGAKKDLEYVEKREASLEERAVKNAQPKERSPHISSPSNVTAADLKAILETPTRPTPPEVKPIHKERPHQNGIAI